MCGNGDRMHVILHGEPLEDVDYFKHFGSQVAADGFVYLFSNISAVHITAVKNVDSRSLLGNSVQKIESLILFSAESREVENPESMQLKPGSRI